MPDDCPRSRQRTRPPQTQKQKSALIPLLFFVNPDSPLTSCWERVETPGRGFERAPQIQIPGTPALFLPGVTAALAGVSLVQTATLLPQTEPKSEQLQMIKNTCV